MLDADKQCMKLAQEAYEDYGEGILRLDGFDSQLLAVYTRHGITLFQSGGGYSRSGGGTGEPNVVHLPEDCFKGLVKLINRIQEDKANEKDTSTVSVTIDSSNKSLTSRLSAWWSKLSR